MNYTFMEYRVLHKPTYYSCVIIAGFNELAHIKIPCKFAKHSIFGVEKLVLFVYKYVKTCV